MNTPNLYKDHKAWALGKLSDILVHITVKQAADDMPYGIDDDSISALETMIGNVNKFSNYGLNRTVRAVALEKVRDSIIATDSPLMYEALTVYDSILKRS